MVGDGLGNPTKLKVMSLLSKNLESLKAASGYKFSATKINDLQAAEYTLATLVIDGSDSVSSYILQLENMIKTVFNAMKKSPRADNLMLRVVRFSNDLTEIHGFKLLSTIQESDYNGVLQVGGMTALYEATDEAIQSTAAYGKTLLAKDFSSVNGIVVVVTDGQNNRGTIQDPAVVAKSLANARKAECLESLLTILVGVTSDDSNDVNSLDFYLKTFKTDGTLDQYVSIGTATPGRIAKLAQFISQSVSSQSSSLGSGQASQPINPSQFSF
jgi:uncharacterized protein YegL